MMRTRSLSHAVLGVLLVAFGAAPHAAAATLDESAPPGANYDQAEFRFWYPDSAGPLRALVILVPGSNGDGRPQVDEEFWREFRPYLPLYRNLNFNRETRWAEVLFRLQPLFFRRFSRGSVTPWGP